MTSPQTPASDLPPEQQLAFRLESIFMPQARKQRDEHHAREGHELGARFVHYTSAESALSIIKSKRLWMRNSTCMSDFREMQHGFDILARFFSDQQKKAAFKAALDMCAPGAADEAITLFDQWWETIRFHTYIASLSEHLNNEDLHGRLSMWRAFGNSAAPRVATVIRIPQFSGGAIALNLIFSPVAYFTEAETHGLRGALSPTFPAREMVFFIPWRVVAEESGAAHYGFGGAMLLDLLGPMVRPPAAPSISVLVIFRFGATVNRIRCGHARARLGGAMLLDLLDLPSRCSGSWPHDSMVRSPAALSPIPFS
jgi:hypothetical protein